MILLEYLHDMDGNVTHSFLYLEPSLAPSRMPKPNVRKHCFQNKRFLFLKTSYRVSVKSIGQLTLRGELLDNSPKQSWVRLRDELLNNSPRQFFEKSSFEIPFTIIFIFPSCHAITPIFLGCPSAYEMHYVNFIQHMPIYQSCIH